MLPKKRKSCQKTATLKNKDTPRNFRNGITLSFCLRDSALALHLRHPILRDSPEFSPLSVLSDSIIEYLIRQYYTTFSNISQQVFEKYSKICFYIFCL